MMKKMLLTLLAAAAFGGAEGKVYYVSNSGSNKNPGTEKAPWATIAFAAQKAAPGDTVKVAPGLYRGQVNFKRSGTKNAPIVFSGTRGKNGEFLTIVESEALTLDKWVPAPEIAPDVWKTKLARRPGLILMDGRMIALINPRTMELKRWKKLPSILRENDIWGAWGPRCKRVPGLDLLALNKDIKVAHPYFGKRQEFFWPVLNYVLAGWQKGTLYLRFANGSTPQKHQLTATFDDGFVLDNVSHLKISDFHMRGSRSQVKILGKSSFVTVEKCLLMHGNARIRIDRDAEHTLVRDCILTSGFTRDDLFGLRSSADMRGGLLYLIFKYIIGTSVSEDAGVNNLGKKTSVIDNVIVKGLLGIQAFGPDVTVRGNVVREMSSVGICTGPHGGGEFYENIIMNCGIPLRIHRIREKRRDPLRTEYHYRNLFVQAPHGGGKIFVHCSSQSYGDDVINFEKNAKGKLVYKQNPPAPVDPGRFYIYHNTFWGGEDGSYGMNVQVYAKRFRTVMPFCFINNIIKFCPRHTLSTLDAMDGNLFYLFGPSVQRDKEVREPALYKVNRSIGIVKHEKIWNTKCEEGLPDVTPAAGSPALECGIDVTQARLCKSGRTIPALPGFAPGYFKGKAPAAGAFQPGESQKKFFDMHRKALKSIALINGLSKNTK